MMIHWNGRSVSDCGLLQNHRDLDVIYTDNDKIDMNDAPVTSQFRRTVAGIAIFILLYVHLKIFRTVDQNAWRAAARI
jgi:hypothetical protein